MTAALETESTETDEVITDRSTRTPNDYADRIRKLLDLAERASTDAERDAFNARAQSLMQRYEISDQMIAQARGASAEVQDTITNITIKQTGIFGKERRLITAAVAKASTVYLLWDDTKAQKPSQRADRRAVPASSDLIIIGYSRDLERLQLLDASLQLQAAAALSAWQRNNAEELKDKTGWAKFQDRRTFLEGFARGLGDKLYIANQQAREEFVKDRAYETHTAQSEVRTGMELAVRSRRESVKDWVDSHYSTGRYRGGRGGGGGSSSSRSGGYSAGQSASVGQGTVGGGRRALEA
jgi:hypothetical protein